MLNARWVVRGAGSNGLEDAETVPSTLPIFFLFEHASPRSPPISMLLPAVLPAVAEVRADAVFRVHVNLEIGGTGGIRPVIHV